MNGFVETTARGVFFEPIDITPNADEISAGIKLAGHSGRTDNALGVLDRLFLRMKAVDVDGKTIVWVHYDLLSVGEGKANDIRDRAFGRFPDAIAVFVTSTHTHAAPKDEGPWWDRVFELTLESLDEMAVRFDTESEVVNLGSFLSPSEVNVCRRYPNEDGGMDLEPYPEGFRIEEVTSLLWLGKGAVLSGASSVAMHSTTLGRKNLYVASDSLGAFQEHLERFISGPWIGCMGGGGNQCALTRGAKDPVIGWSHYDYGMGLAGEMGRSGYDYRLHIPSFAATSRVLQLPGKDLGTIHKVDATAVRLSSDLYVLSTNAEIFAEIAESIRALFGERVLILDKDGEVGGYILTDQAFEEGDSYELGACKHGEGGGPQLVEETVEMLEEVKAA